MEQFAKLGSDLEANSLKHEMISYGGAPTPSRFSVQNDIVKMLTRNPGNNSPNS